MRTLQQTIQNTVSLSGKGIHSGVAATATFKPAPADSGYTFVRVDLPGAPTIKADVDNVTDTSRSTTLQQNGATISTIEHTLAALVAMEIDNCVIEVDGPEMPIMDGSGKPFADLLATAGIQELDAVLEYYNLPETIRITDGDTEIIAVPADEFEITVMIDYSSQTLGFQHATCTGVADFRRDFIDARTFVFLHEVEDLFKRNLIKGGDLTNALVIVDRPLDDAKVEELKKMFNLPNVKMTREGFLNNVEPRHTNEPARHKLLDVVGDLTLVGIPFKAKVIASRPGHATNVKLAKRIKQLIKQQKVKSRHKPEYDPNVPPLFDTKAILKSLPHKYPLLLVDKIIEMTDKYVVGIKNVTINENFFPGHFPENPVMPGVLQIEALAQTGGILMLQTVDNPAEWDTLFLKIDNAKFKNIVVPGDTLILKMELLSPIRRGICEMHGTAYVGDKVVCEADLVAKIIKK